MWQGHAPAGVPQNPPVPLPMRHLLRLSAYPLGSWSLLAVCGAAALGLTGLWPGAPGWVIWAGRAALLLLLAAALLRLLQGLADTQDRSDEPGSPGATREHAADLERRLRQLSEQRVEELIERERKRIAADLHDDLGAKLLTIVHTCESERISSLAREALEEMRLSVRGLTGRTVNLADALGDWRVEVVSRLSQAGIECDWQVPEDWLTPMRLSARAYVQATRILRESISNVIRHSGASRCSVNCDVDAGDFHLVVQDNGHGIASEVEARLDRGHGLAGMKHRAKQLDGQCLVESAPGRGTVIRLTLPIDRPAGIA